MNYKKIIFIFCVSIFLFGERNADAQTMTFNYTGATQLWTVPACVFSVTYDVAGAQGGSNGATGGLGARMRGVVNVTPSQVLTIYVGGQGGATYEAGSGGGGSGIALASTPLVVAGAGGGASLIDNVAGMPGLTGKTGGSSSGLGGTGGAGGDKGYFSGDCGWAAGGGGFSGDGYGGNGPGDGGALPGTLYGIGAGQSALHGGAGGVDGSCNGGGANGGWGCGGGGSGNYGAGGGGGYSGGGGGQYRVAATSPGGGGGSYTVGIDTVNTPGYEVGNGYVKLTWVISNVPASDTGRVIKNVSCHGGSDGQAYAIVTGVALSYLWTPVGGTKDTAVGLSAGTYTIAVSSVCGGSATSTVTITQPVVMGAPTVVATKNILCNGGNNGIATATPGGGGSPFIYTWTPSNQTTAAATGLTAGTYSVTVKDACGATASSTVTITQPLALVVAANATASVSCYQSSNGSASSTVTNGTKPYTYSWLPSGGNLDTAVGLAAGVYTLNVVDHNGCTGSASIVITQPAKSLSTAASKITDVLCHGANTGSALTNTAGGSAPYTYLWSPLGGTNAIANGLKAGSDTVYVTDNHGCTATSNVTVTEPTALTMTRNTTPDDGTCTGSAWVVVRGGVLPYVYLWTDGDTSYYVHYTCHGEFCCTVRDIQGCLDSVCMDVISTAGVNTIASDGGKINVYPNPNNGQFTIESTLANGEASSVEIYNVLGAKVYTMDLNTGKGGNTTVNMGTQPNGIYLYRVIGNENGNLLGQGKIVLQK